MKNFIFLSIAIILISANIATAGIINIPEDYDSIQEAINASSDSDTVLIHPGTYWEFLNFNGKNIVVSSLFWTTGDTSYISQTIIDANLNSSVVTFESGEDTTATLSELTLIDGKGNSAGQGGGIYCGNSTPKLQNLMITDNMARYGAGIYCYYSDIVVENTTIHANEAWGNVENYNVCGGGILIEHSDLTLKNVKILNNEAKNQRMDGILPPMAAGFVPYNPI